MFRGLGNAPSCRAPFAAACARGDAIEVKSLLAADPSAAHATDANGWTPLMFAASNGRVDIILLLLGCNPDIDAANSFRWTALYAACANGHLPAVQVPPSTLVRTPKLNVTPVQRRRFSMPGHATTCPSAAVGRRSCLRRRAIA
jgi:hypothetical protein